MSDSEDETIVENSVDSDSTVGPSPSILCGLSRLKQGRSLLLSKSELPDQDTRTICQVKEDGDCNVSDESQPLVTASSVASYSNPQQSVDISAAVSDTSGDGRDTRLAVEKTDVVTCPGSPELCCPQKQRKLEEKESNHAINRTYKQDEEDITKIEKLQSRVQELLQDSSHGGDAIKTVILKIQHALKTVSENNKKCKAEIVRQQRQVSTSEARVELRQKLSCLADRQRKLLQLLQRQKELSGQFRVLSGSSQKSGGDVGSTGSQPESSQGTHPARQPFLTDGQRTTSSGNGGSRGNDGSKGNDGSGGRAGRSSPLDATELRGAPSRDSGSQGGRKTKTKRGGSKRKVNAAKRDERKVDNDTTKFNSDDTGLVPAISSGASTAVPAAATSKCAATPKSSSSGSVAAVTNTGPGVTVAATTANPNIMPRPAPATKYVTIPPPITSQCYKIIVVPHQSASISTASGPAAASHSQVVPRAVRQEFLTQASRSQSAPSRSMPPLCTVPSTVRYQIDQSESNHPQSVSSSMRSAATTPPTALALSAAVTKKTTTTTTAAQGRAASVRTAAPTASRAHHRTAATTNDDPSRSQASLSQARTSSRSGIFPSANQNLTSKRDNFLSNLFHECKINLIDDGELFNWHSILPSDFWKNPDADVPQQWLQEITFEE